MKTSRSGFRSKRQRFGFIGNITVIDAFKPKEKPIKQPKQPKQPRQPKEKKWSDDFVLNLANRISRGELTLKAIKDVDLGLWRRVYNVIFYRFSQEFVLAYLREISPEIQTILDLLEIPNDMDFADYLTPEIKEKVLSNGKVIKERIYSWSPENLWDEDDELSPVEKVQLQVDELMFAAENQLNNYVEDILPICKQAISRNAIINYDLLGVYQKDLKTTMNTFKNTKDSIEEFQACLSNLNKTLEIMKEPHLVDTLKHFRRPHHFNGTIRNSGIPSGGTRLEFRSEYDNYKSMQAFFLQARKIILSKNNKVLRNSNIDMNSWVRLQEMLDMLEMYPDITYKELKEITHGETEDKK